MYKLNSVLRSLVLLFLSSWVGMVVQSAEAQQTVSPCPVGLAISRQRRRWGGRFWLSERVWSLQPGGT